jgi:hypothetical protein
MGSSGGVLLAGELVGIFSSELLNPLDQGFFEFEQAGVIGIEVGGLVDVIENSAK